MKVGSALDAALTAVFVLAGCGCIVYGVWRISEPAAWIVGGALLLVPVWPRRPAVEVKDK